MPVISADREGIVTRPDAPAQRGQSGPEGRSRKTRPVPPATVGRLPRRQQPSDRPHPSASQSPTHRRHHHRRHLILVTEYLWGSTTGPSPCWKETPSTSPPIQSAPRHPAGPAKPDRTDADACAKYLTNEAAYPDYSAALPEGWPIASGVTERTCRNLVADRRDITGAEPVLKLRAVHANDDFRRPPDSTNDANTSTTPATPKVSSRSHSRPPRAAPLSFGACSVSCGDGVWDRFGLSLAVLSAVDHRRGCRSECEEIPQVDHAGDDVGHHRHG